MSIFPFKKLTILLPLLALSSCSSAKASSKVEEQASVIPDLIEESCEHTGDRTEVKTMFTCKIKLVRAYSGSSTSSSGTQCMIVYVENCKEQGPSISGTSPNRFQFLYDGDTSSADPVVAFFTARAPETNTFKVALSGTVYLGSGDTNLSMKLDSDGTVILE